MAKKQRELGTIHRCLVCDTYAIHILKTVPAATAFPGKAGSEKFYNLLYDIQEELCKSKILFLACPTCAEIYHKISFSQYTADRTTDAVLTPCSITKFEEDQFAPLYLNASPADKKPKWTLSQGVGPRTLELDNSHSGRLYKPTLRQYGINGPMLMRDEDMAVNEEVKYIVDTIYSCAYGQDVDLDWASIEEMCPLIHHWEEAQVHFLKE